MERRGWIQNSPESARLSLHFRTRNRVKGSPQATHTNAPCKNRQKLPSAEISSAVFLRTRTWHHQQTEKQKTASQNKISIKFYIPQWTVENVRKNNMVTPCQKRRATYFYVIYRSIFKKRARCGSVLRATYVLLKLELFSTQLYSRVYISLGG